LPAVHTAARRFAYRSNAPQFSSEKSDRKKAAENGMLAVMGGFLQRELPGGAEAHDRRDPDEETGRVVQLRPRLGAVRGRGTRPAVEDIGKYERDGSDDDDYRHRMYMNVIGFLACALLVAAGVWIANAIAELRKNQDCVLSGRHDCAHLDAPTRLRW
jgi:hypothetical protein